MVDIYLFSNLLKSIRNGKILKTNIQNLTLKN
jgi:hypothetical protein